MCGSRTGRRAVVPARSDTESAMATAATGVATVRCGAIPAATHEAWRDVERLMSRELRAWRSLRHAGGGVAARKLAREFTKERESTTEAKVLYVIDGRVHAGRFDGDTGRLAGRVRRMVCVQWAGVQRSTGEAWPNSWVPWSYLNAHLVCDARQLVSTHITTVQQPVAAQPAAGQRISPRLAGHDAVAGGAASGAEGADAGADASPTGTALNCGGQSAGQALREAMVPVAGEVTRAEASSTGAMGVTDLRSDSGTAAAAAVIAQQQRDEELMLVEVANGEMSWQDILDRRPEACGVTDRARAAVQHAGPGGKRHLAQLAGERARRPREAARASDANTGANAGAGGSCEDARKASGSKSSGKRPMVWSAAGIARAPRATENGAAGTSRATWWAESEASSDDEL